MDGQCQNYIPQTLSGDKKHYSAVKQSDKCSVISKGIQSKINFDI